MPCQSVRPEPAPPTRPDPRPDVTALPGRDHRSLLLFVQTVEANNGGDVRQAATQGCMPGSSRMRDRRSADLVASDGTVWGSGWKPEYGTRYDDGRRDPYHDDWACLIDLEEWGFLDNQGTGLQPIVSLTPKGHALCAELIRARGIAARKSGVTGGV